MKILIAEDDEVTRLVLEDNQAENVEHIITSGHHKKKRAEIGRT